MWNTPWNFTPCGHKRMKSPRTLHVIPRGMVKYAMELPWKTSVFHGTSTEWNHKESPWKTSYVFAHMEFHGPLYCGVALWLSNKEDRVHALQEDGLMWIKDFSFLVRHTNKLLTSPYPQTTTRSPPIITSVDLLNLSDKQTARQTSTQTARRSLVRSIERSTAFATAPRRLSSGA